MPKTALAKYLDYANCSPNQKLHKIIIIFEFEFFAQLTCNEAILHFVDGSEIIPTQPKTVRESKQSQGAVISCCLFNV